MATPYTAYIRTIINPNTGQKVTDSTGAIIAFASPPGYVPIPGYDEPEAAIAATWKRWYGNLSDVSTDCLPTPPVSGAGDPVWLISTLGGDPVGGQYISYDLYYNVVGSAASGQTITGIEWGTLPSWLAPSASPSERKLSLRGTVPSGLDKYEVPLTLLQSDGRRVPRKFSEVVSATRSVIVHQIYRSQPKNLTVYVGSASSVSPTIQLIYAPAGYGFRDGYEMFRSASPNQLNGLTYPFEFTYNFIITGQYIFKVIHLGQTRYVTLDIVDSVSVSTPVGASSSVNLPQPGQPASDGTTEIIVDDPGSTAPTITQQVIGGVISLYEGESGEVWVNNNYSDNSQGYYIGGGSFSFDTPYPNGVTFPMLSNGRARISVPDDCVNKDEPGTLRFTFDTGQPSITQSFTFKNKASLDPNANPASHDDMASFHGNDFSSNLGNNFPPGYVTPNGGSFNWGNQTLCQTNPSAGRTNTDVVSMLFTGNANSPSLGNNIMVAKVKPTQLTGDSRIGIGLQHYTDRTGGYSFIISNANTIAFLHDGVAFGPSYPYSVQVNSWYWMKMKSIKSGNTLTLSAKIWRAGEPEPAPWYEWSGQPDRVGYPALLGGVDFGNGPSTACFDDWYDGLTPGYTPNPCSNYFLHPESEINALPIVMIFEYLDGNTSMYPGLNYTVRSFATRTEAIANIGIPNGKYHFDMCRCTTANLNIGDTLYGSNRPEHIINSTFDRWPAEAGWWGFNLFLPQNGNNGSYTLFQTDQCGIIITKENRVLPAN